MPSSEFGPLSAAEVAQVLVRDHRYSESDACAAAADADGSVGRALAADSTGLAEAREDARRLLQQAAKTDDPARRLDAAKDLSGTKGTSASDREQMATCLRALASLLRDLGFSRRGRTVARWPMETSSQLEGLTSTFDHKRSLKAYAAVDEALAALERNASPKVVADWLVLQL